MGVIAWGHSDRYSNTSAAQMMPNLSEVAPVLIAEWGGATEDGDLQPL